MNREDTIYYAKLAEQAERYDDMVKHMKQIATVSLMSLLREIKNSPTKNGTCWVLHTKTRWEQEEQRGEP